MVYIIPNFLDLLFGENFMKIWTKKAKLQMHENLHKNVNENITCFHSHFYANFHYMFSFTFLCKFSWAFKKAIKATNALHCLFLICFLIHLQWPTISFRQHQIFLILMRQILYSQIQQALGPDFRKVGKPLMGIARMLNLLYTSKWFY